MNVKAGDKVIYRNGHNLDKIAEVVKVTTTGRIKITGNQTYFNNLGYPIGSGAGVIKEATPEEIIKIEQDEKIRECLRKMRHVESLTYEQAVEILDILKEVER